MDVPGSGCLLVTVIVLALTTFFSVTYLALRHVGWAKLEEAFAKKKRPEKARNLWAMRTELIFYTGNLRLLTNLFLLLCLAFSRSATITSLSRIMLSKISWEKEKMNRAEKFLTFFVLGLIFGIAIYGCVRAFL